MSQQATRRSKARNALEALKAVGLKRTKPREILLCFLAENHGPFSAKDLHSALKKKGLDAVTTYRCLAAFEKSNLVRRCDFGDGIARYEFIGGKEHHHHHVICVDCRKIEQIDDCELVELESRVKDLGYSRIRHVLEFRGICSDCSKKSA